MALAQRLKAKHLDAHPDYQYQPRKPGQKKRRQRRARADGNQSQVNLNAAINLNAQPVTTNNNANPVIAPMQLNVVHGGHYLVELGNEIVNDEALQNALERHNTLVPNHPNYVSHISYPMAAWNAPTFAAQDEENFFNSVFDWEEFDKQAKLLEAANAKEQGLAATDGNAPATTQRFDFELEDLQFLEGFRQLGERYGTADFDYRSKPY